MSNQRYISAAEIPSLGIPDYAKPERIRFDISRIRTIAALGCAYGDIGFTSYRQQTRDQDMSVGGAANNGTAYGALSFGMQQRLRLGRAYSEPLPGPRIVHRYGLTIGVNTSEIARQVSDKKRAYDPALWARYLDRAVSQALRQAAWENVGWAWPHASEAVFDTAMVAATIGAYYGLDKLDFSLLRAYQGALIAGWAGGALCRALSMEDEGRSAGEVCYSLLPYIHPDRALLATLGTWGLRLVAAARQR